jgi:hypothetical protein
VTGFEINITEIKKDLKSSNWEIILCATLLFILFQKSFEIFWDKISYIYPESIIEPSVFTDIILIFFLIFVPFRIFKGFKSSTNLFLLSNLALLVFIKIRYSPNSLVYLDLVISKGIHYVDLIWFIYLMVFISWISQYKVQEQTIAPFFSEDSPLINEKDDELNFKDYAKEISDKISIGTYKKAFAIGINGKWGSGKTSLLNLIIEQIKKEESNVIINFNPWNYKSADLLMLALFDSISETIKPYNKSVGKEIIHYANKLIGNSENVILKFVKNALSITAEDRSIAALRESIDTHIKKLNIKLFITIDDLDRLHFDEINAILKLVRNTANFHNTIFFLLYDKPYITKAIEHLNPTNSNDYMEKIVQLEINIPVYENTIIKDNLYKILKHRLPADLHNELKSIFTTDSNGIDHISFIISNLRDVNRLVNAISLNYSNLHGEVIFQDFFKIEILRYKFPNVYDLLKHDQRHYLTTEVKSERHNFVLAKNATGVNANSYKIYNKIESLYPSINTDRIINFLESIFTESRSSYYNNSKRLSIVYPSNFNRYFRYLITNGEVSESSFSNARQKGIKQLKIQIKFWVEKKLVSELKYLLQSIESFDNFEDFKNIIRSIFYFANFKQPENPYRTRVGFNDDKILRKFENYTKVESINKITSFFFSLLKESISSQDYIFTFVKNILSNNEVYFFSKDELQNNYFSQLQYIITRIPAPNREFWHIYNYHRETKVWETINTVPTSYDSTFEPIRLMLKERFMNFDVDWLIPELIDFNRINDGATKKLSSEFIFEMFGNMDEFEIFLMSLKEKQSNTLNEFLDFYEKIKSNKFQPIAFNFSKIRDTPY